MTFDEYQAEVSKTAIPLTCLTNRVQKGVLGLASEAGELCGLVEKYLYQGHSLPDDKLCKELGDVLWYLTYLCDVLGFTLEEIAMLNVHKLRERYPQGKFDAADSIARVDGG